ncbi:MAG TPA: hypothetical protein VEX38_07080, partial [Fimbriimonadaceae bacterium]|nr:hypothetical protein [Fimbriimonadaceae bacterium]
MARSQSSVLTLLSAAVALASLTASTPPQTWYGPATVEFQVQWPGNPYDPEQNDVRVVFTGSRGEKVERLAYFDRGSWRASLVAPNGGRYRPVLLRNGATSIQEAVPPVVELKEKMAFGFVRNDEIAANRFRSDN